MNLLGLAFSLTLLFVNFLGASLLASFIWRNTWIAAMAGPWLVATVVFSIETYSGLGPNPHWLGATATIVSLGLIGLSVRIPSPLFGRPIPAFLQKWRSEVQLRDWAYPVACFILLFSYALFWRILRPEIDGSSEKIPDLGMIVGYMTGDTIPVPDAWFHPFRMTQYYGFQHYCASLLGRSFGFSPGVAYNLGFCTLVAYTGLAFSGAVFLMARRGWVRALLIAGFVIGGTGTSGIVHVVYKDPQPWNTMRFIGGVPYDTEPLGKKLQAYAATFPKLELPGEPFSYDVFLGDYHAPISGFCLLALGVAAAAYWQRSRTRGSAMLVGATLTWTVIAHTWVFPLQALAVVAWCLWNRVSWRELWPFVLLGAVTVWALLHFYLAPFTAASLGYNTHLRLVRGELHTPILLYVIYWLPTIVLTVTALYSRVKHGIALGVLALGFLLIGEFFYIDDVYSVEFERFNTTLKWWPWVGTLALLILGPVLLEQSGRRWIRAVGVAFCLYPCAFGYDLVRNLWHTDTSNFARLDGHAFIDKEEGSRILLARLKQEARGVVMERPTRDSFSNSACLPLFAGDRLWLGWMGHEQLWRGYSGDVAQRYDRLVQLFAGEIPDAGSWVAAEGISYVLWYQPADVEDLWAKLNPALESHFTWCPVFVQPDGRKVGFWRRRP